MSLSTFGLGTATRVPGGCKTSVVTGALENKEFSVAGGSLASFLR